ncbi:MAG: GntR family transcriptional regulator, partial [Solibacillus sp.]
MEQKHTKKMFLQIVKQLRDLIADQNIQEGEKLPSERVLSEQLNVGRSSVREALRSLELLGLIETKHGDGTYLTSMKQHHLVEIVGSFILQDARSVADVHATREMHEKEAIKIICQSETLRKLPVWESIFVKVELEQSLQREAILRECMIVTENRLAFKIWLQLSAYSNSALVNDVTFEEKPHLQILLASMQMGYLPEAIEAYEKWIKTM